MKRILAWLPLVLLVLVFLGIYLAKDSMTGFASRMIKEQTSVEIQDAGAAFVDSAFNYVRNGADFTYTFLEFGAKGCSACKKMELVMSEIRAKHPDKVNVVFINVLLPENQNLMKYFGVVAIPTQVLLNKEGVEFFRHSGYISTNDILSEMKLTY
jgi:thiol-disulfide isomerase/thioredoxin